MGPDKVEQVVRAAKKAGIPMRIGANSGSLPKHLHALAQQDQAEALVAAALEEVELLEKLEYRDFKISVKATHVPTMIRAYRMLSAKVPYPLHLGVTEAGTEFAGAIKSSVGIGSLLADGIGDTMRVSLTADPVKEIEVAWEILKALGLRERGPVMIACPSCGRDNVGVESLARVVEDRLRAYPEAFEVAVMGCAVNGPGEAGDADFGIAGGRDVGLHLRARPRAQEGAVGDAHRRALRRDRPLARGRDEAPEAAQDGEAGRARDGRSLAHPARVAQLVSAGQLMIARQSQLFIPTLREAPADAEAVSHKLLVRGGYIRQVSAGVWTFLPLGWRVHQKVVQIIREEMDAIGGQEMLMPVLTPRELWQRHEPRSRSTRCSISRTGPGASTSSR